MEWFGWSFFRFTSPNGKVILTNPFITGNPDASVKVEDIAKADLILVTDAHRDEVGDAVAIAKGTGASIVTPSFEFGTVLAAWGVPATQIMRRNPGGRFTWEGITIRVVGAVHGSAATDPSSKFPSTAGSPRDSW
jgi:L-ascorbate metabolism protein UlaG (beta-lactamase superfamily)